MGDDDANTMSIICKGENALILLESWRKMGQWVLYDKNNFIIDGRQKTSAMHIMHANNRALVRIWLGLNEEICSSVALCADNRLRSNAISEEQ